MIARILISERTHSILRGAIAVLIVAACYEATARSGVFARGKSASHHRTPAAWSGGTTRFPSP